MSCSKQSRAGRSCTPASLLPVQCAAPWISCISMYGFFGEHKHLPRFSVVCCSLQNQRLPVTSVCPLSLKAAVQKPSQIGLTHPCSHCF